MAGIFLGGEDYSGLSELGVQIKESAERRRRECHCENREGVQMSLWSCPVMGAGHTEGKDLPQGVWMGGLQCF